MYYVIETFRFCNRLLPVTFTLILLDWLHIHKTIRF